MKKIRFHLLSFAQLHIALTGLFLFLLFAANCIPQERIWANAEHSIHLLAERPGSLQEQSLLELFSPNTEDSTFYRSLRGMGSSADWGGAQILLRPLLYLFQIEQIHALCSLVFFLLFFAAAYTVGKRLSFPCGLLFAGAILWSDVLAVSTIPQQAGCYFIAFCAILALPWDRQSVWNGYDIPLSRSFYVIGAWTAFESGISGLPYIGSSGVPAITLGLPAAACFTYYCAHKPDKGLSALWRFAFHIVSAWFSGYLLMLATKWLVSGIAFGINPGSIALDAARQWLIVSPQHIFPALWGNIRAYLSHAGYGLPVLAFLFAVSTAAFLLLYLKGHKQDPWRSLLAAFPLLFIGITPYLVSLALPGSIVLDTGISLRQQAAAAFPALMALVSLLDMDSLSKCLQGSSRYASRKEDDV